jgi:hypothetical protein
LEETFGFQKDSVANQLEHLESLLVWSITQRLIAFEGRFSADPVREQSRVMATAIQALHDKILSRVATWRERGVVAATSTSTTSDTSFPTRHLQPRALTTRDAVAWQSF